MRTSANIADTNGPRDILKNTKSVDLKYGTSTTDWEREALTEFFRHCPGCGRRFHIMLESKKLISEHRESIPGRKVLRTAVVRGSRGAGSSATPIAVQEGKPTISDIEEFQYAYKCGHCGHEWSETRLKSRREG